MLIMICVQVIMIEISRLFISDRRKASGMVFLYNIVKIVKSLRNYETEKKNRERFSVPKYSRNKYIIETGCF